MATSKDVSREIEDNGNLFTSKTLGVLGKYAQQRQALREKTRRRSGSTAEEVAQWWSAKRKLRELDEFYERVRKKSLELTLDVTSTSMPNPTPVSTPISSRGSSAQNSLSSSPAASPVVSVTPSTEICINSVDQLSVIKLPPSSSSNDQKKSAETLQENHTVSREVVEDISKKIREIEQERAAERLESQTYVELFEDENAVLSTQENLDAAINIFRGLKKVPKKK